MNGAILLLGMHRSGTSCLAGMLAALGAMPPGATVRNWDNARGHFEALDLVRLNEAVLSHSDGHWLKAPAAVRWEPEHAAARDALLAQPDSLLKDPRSLLTLPFWRERAPRMIGIIRHPLAVARSLLAWRQMPLAEGLRLWTAHNRPLLAAHEELGFPLLDFDAEPEAFLTATARAAAALGLEPDPAALRGAYAAELAHHAGGDCDDAEALALHAAMAARCIGSGAARAGRGDFPWELLTDPQPARIRDALAKAPDTAAVVVPVVASLLKRGRAAEALALLGNVPRLDPALADLLAGKALLALGDAAGAVERLARAGAAPDAAFEARLLLPQALRRAGRGREAREALAALVDQALYPHGPLSTLAEWAHEDGDDGAARTLFAQAIGAAPIRRRGRLRTRLAELLLATGEPAGAEAELRASLTEDPAWTRAGELLARLEGGPRRP